MATVQDHVQARTEELLENLDQYDRRETIEALLLSAPYLIAFSAFLAYPLLLGLWMSFHNWNPVFVSRTKWVGLQNYAELLSDPLFWTSVVNTTYFVVITVPAIVILSLLLALGVNRNIKGRGVLRTIFFSPYVLTVSVIGLLWVEIFEQGGMLNYYLDFFMREPPHWLTSTTFAMPAISIATIWWGLAFSFVIMLAARQNIPEQLYEAARLDGASSWRAMIDITIPQMRNPILFVVITQFVAQFQLFGQPFIMTGGGPVDSTTTIVMYLYESAFSSREFGYAAAIGYVLFLILLAVSLVNFYVIGQEET